MEQRLKSYEATPQRGLAAGQAIEPRRLAVPDQLDGLHNSLETLGNQLSNLRDRLSTVLSHERPQEVGKDPNKTNCGRSIADAIHSASTKVGALSELVDDLMHRLQV